MAIRSRAYWIALLITGYKPTQEDYADLVESLLSLYDDLTPKSVGVTLGSPNTMVLDCLDQNQVMYEAQKSIGVTQPIDVSYTLSFTNNTNTKLISKILQVTGTITITMPSSVLCSNPSLIGTWNDGAKTLELAAGTADKIEMQFIKYDLTGEYLLKVAEVAL